MVIVVESTVFESKKVKRVTIPTAFAKHLNIQKGDSLYLFVIGNILCYATDNKTVKDFLNRIADRVTEYLII